MDESENKEVQVTEDIDIDIVKKTLQSAARLAEIDNEQSETGKDFKKVLPVTATLMKSLDKVSTEPEAREEILRAIQYTFYTSRAESAIQSERVKASALLKLQEKLLDENISPDLLLKIATAISDAGVPDIEVGLGGKGKHPNTMIQINQNATAVKNESDKVNSALETSSGSATNTINSSTQLLEAVGLVQQWAKENNTENIEDAEFTETPNE